ncbi:MAG TPA: alpha/beta hydrolase, partial [Pyrinomonadaceae bacterium]|nr:alpha/beta hydrolase [Pyrinomonadaceae bacterium]
MSDSSANQATKLARVRDLEMVHVDSGEGPAVLFLHGYPFDKSMWSEQLAAIAAAGFRAIAPDLRGLGETKSSSEVATMDEMARDAAALLDHLRVEKAVICGLSMGGYVAFEFMHLFPARVLGLVLAGTRAPADNEQEKAGREQQVQTMLRAGMVPISIATLPKLLAQRTLAEKPDVVKRVRAMITRSDPKGAAAAQRGMAARRDYSEDLPKIDVPTLIIVGREDSIRPVADAEFMHRGISNSRLEIIDDAAHMTNMEQPEVFNVHIAAFCLSLGTDEV